ncbi:MULTISPECIES: IucA/IucC family protein [unclassified Undibacterium]|nr:MULTISPECIES: IucA/IucC family protein [unclassified Undibacterium]MEB0215175.1 IucA/IucC family protein [Undibacterium sp. 5I2]WPX44852.1 IucA/IucC family protein [Undibacterium sp. CCC3.4]
MNVSTHTPPAPLQSGTDLMLEQAQRDGLHRFLQALLRENFLFKPELISDAGLTWIPLWSEQMLLRVEGLRLGRAGHCHISGAITLYKNAQAPQLLRSAGALLAHLSGTPYLPLTPAAQRRLAAELDNSAANDALSLHYRRQWGEQLRRLASTHHHPSFFSLLWHEELVPDPCLLLEQWGSQGHPFHPAHKSKLGLTKHEVLAYAPEFQAQFPLRLAAVRRACMRVTMSRPERACRAWLSRHFGTELQAWEQALRASGREPSEWLPLPLHPYQASAVLPQKFASEIAAGQLLLDTGISLRAAATMSMRTVVPLHRPGTPHIKLPLGVQLTSAVRTVSNKACIMGPRLTTLLRAILLREQHFNGSLDILGEELGMHFIDPNKDSDKHGHLTLLLRENPLEKRDQLHLPLPVASLFASSPVSGRPFITELVTAAVGDHPAAALSYFRDYCHVVLKACLSAYLLYGIAFEAHQQNSAIIVNRRGQPCRLLLRDFGDLRIHSARLTEQHCTLDNYQAGQILFTELAPVREKFLHATMLCHLAELGMLLAQTYQQEQDCYWKIIQHVSANLFSRLRPRCQPAYWERERHAILHADWPVKALLRMRCEDAKEDLCGSMPNPLRNFP